MIGSTTDQTATNIIRDAEMLASRRGNFEGQWREISERMIPNGSDLFFAAGATGRSVGQKGTDKMLDSTAAIALERYSSVLASLLTPMSQKWHRLRSNDASLNRKPRVAQWFDACTDILFAARMAPRSGFYGQMNMSYLSIGAFGTGLVFVDHVAPSPTDPAGGLRYRHTHISEAFLRENHQGVVDTIIRKFPLTHRQVKRLVDQGTLDKLPRGLDAFLKDPKQADGEWTYIHSVRPNEEYEIGRLDFRGRPYIEHYVCQQTQETIGTAGYYTFPYGVGRAVVSPGEVYGRSPGMTVLANVKVLNEEKRTMLKMGHRLADPILLVGDDGILDTYSARPGSLVAGGLNSQGQKLVQRLDENVGQLPQLADLMQQEKDVINDAFLVTMFQILVENKTRMTATEVLERTREKSQLLAPTMARLQGEFLGPLIEREVDLMIRAGKFPEMPPELIEAEGEYHVEYDSPLSRMARAEEAAGFSRWVEQSLIAAQATQDPAPLDWVDWDTVQPELADINSVPARWVATPDMVAVKRQGRNQQAAVDNAINAGPSVAALLKADAGT